MQQLGRDLVYLCRSEGQAAVIAKLLPDTSRGASSYPTDLHKAAASKGLAPDLGWVPLVDHDGDIELVTTAAMQALHKLQTELSCAAMHGNLRASSIFVRCMASCGRNPASLVAHMHRLVACWSGASYRPQSNDVIG